MTDTQPQKNPHHTEEDFLDVDKPVPGQSFVCLLFVSLEKILMNKEQWMFYNYYQYVICEYHKIFTELTDKLLESDGDSIPVEGVVDLKDRLNRVFDMNEVEYNKWKELVEDHKFRDGERIEREFDEMNNFQTSVRGVKVRGVYDTYREAEVRSKVLQRTDSRFDVFIGQVGYWLPWHPDVNRIQDQEYMNDDLNTLMKEYKKNEEKRDMFYEQQKQERVKEAREQVERAKALQQEKAKLEAVVEDVTDETSEAEKPMTSSGLESSESQPEQTIEDTATQLQDMDPWMKRKMESSE
jgi:hypothetical protein